MQSLFSNPLLWSYTLTESTDISKKEGYADRNRVYPKRPLTNSWMTDPYESLRDNYQCCKEQWSSSWKHLSVCMNLIVYIDF